MFVLAQQSFATDFQNAAPIVLDYCMLENTAYS
jgi:hypothetical protein